MCIYSGGRLLLCMQEGAAFCWATLGAHVLIIGIHTGANRHPHMCIYVCSWLKFFN